LKPPSASNLSSADLSLLLVSFIPSLDPLLRSLAFLNLSYLSQHPPSPSLSIQYAPLLEDSLISTHPSRLEEALSFFSALLQTNPSEALIVLKRPGLMENIIDLMDLYFLPSSSSSTSTSDPATTATPNVPLALADFCSQAANAKPSRSLLLSSSNTILPWLERQTASPSSDASLRATAAVAIAKLSRGQNSSGEVDILAAAEGGQQEDKAEEEDDSVKDKRDLKLATMMRDLLISSLHSPPPTSISIASVKSPAPVPSSVLNAVEALAFTSLRGPIKELLATSPPFLSRLFALIPSPSEPRSFNSSNSPSLTKPNSPSLNYGVASIIHNLVMYRPQLTAEQAQLDKFRKMTTSTKKKKGAAAVEEDPMDDPPQVRARVRKVLSAGVVPVLISLGRSESQAIRDVVGRCWLSIVEPREERGIVVQQGGAKSIMTIVSSSLESLRSFSSSSSSTSTTDSKPSFLSPSEPSLESSTTIVVPPSLLATLQALSKLLITTPPQILFSPSNDPLASSPSILPLSLLLGHPDASLLQRFEALMGLTNLASLGPVMAGRVASCAVFMEKKRTAVADKRLAKGGKEKGSVAGGSEVKGTVLGKVEELLIEEDNDLVRRACTELICNLLSSDPVFERYSGEVPSSPSPPTIPSSSSPSASSSGSGKATLTPPQTLALSKIHLLLALTTTHDLPTRLASSACLATLTSSPIAARLLLLLPKGPVHTFSLLADLFAPHDPDPDTEEGRESGGGTGGPDEGLVMRGLVLLGNLVKLTGEEGKVVAMGMEGAKMKGALEGLREELDVLEGGAGGEIKGMLEEILRAMKD
jgi:hypothetical protein